MPWGPVENEVKLIEWHDKVNKRLDIVRSSNGLETKSQIEIKFLISLIGGCALACRSTLYRSTGRWPFELKKRSRGDLANRHLIASWSYRQTRPVPRVNIKVAPTSKLCILCTTFVCVCMYIGSIIHKEKRRKWDFGWSQSFGCHFTLAAFGLWRLSARDWVQD